MDIFDILEKILTLVTVLFTTTAVLGGVAFIAYVILGLTVLNNVGSSSGQHTGYVTAVEHNSNLIWASNIVYFKTDAMSSQEDRYCVNDIDLKGRLEDFSRNKTHVTLNYQNDYFVWAWECNGGESIITEVSEK